jgi:DNA-binding transcriptional MerR regulator
VHFSVIIGISNIGGVINIKWTIKQMAQISGISIDSLRYYDKLGIVSPKRFENGYRHYTERDYVYLQYLTVMKYGQFSLAEIKAVIQRLDIEAGDECNRANLDIFISKRTELLEAIENYQGIIKLFDNLFPMILGSKTYCENEGQIKEFVQDIYQQICRKGAKP